MNKTSMLPALPLVQLILLAACGSDSAEPLLGPTAQLVAGATSQWSAWSEPVHLGPLVNSTANEVNPTLSRDGLSLYFGSNRPGGLGGNDIWVAQRECHDCAWGAAVNLGPPINDVFNESTPEFSRDGHLMFFTSNRDGSDDIYLARRSHKNDPFDWEGYVKLGPDVNTGVLETGPGYLQSGEDGGATLYFNRGPNVAGFDIYKVSVGRDGTTHGPAVPVTELNSPATDARPTLRIGGREILFWSNRPGGVGLADVWTASRRSVHDAWSAPTNVGAPVNTALGDLTPSLSQDGRTLVFVSGRPGGLGGLDIWISTRSRIRGDDANHEGDDEVSP